MRANATMLATLVAITCAQGAAAQQTPTDDLCGAIAAGDVDEVRDLLNHGVDPNARDSIGETSLTCAIKQVGILGDANASGQLRAMQFLLEHGAKVDGPDAKGETPLGVAAGNGGNRDQSDGQIAAVRLLLEKGANVNSANNPQKITPLHWASYRGYTASIRLLLDHGADRSVRNTYGETPLDMMAQNPVLDLDKAKEVKALLAEH